MFGSRVAQPRRIVLGKTANPGKVEPDVAQGLQRFTGHLQPLAGLYRTGALTEAIAAAAGTGGLQNLAMRTLLARVQWKDVAVPAHSTADIDTWEDASRWSVAAPAAEEQQGPAASS